MSTQPARYLNDNDDDDDVDINASSASLVPYQPQRSLIVRPVASADEMRAAIHEYEALKSAILQPKDVQRIGNKEHIKKSGWLRIARAFGVTAHIESALYIVADDGRDWGYEVIVRAEAPNGASMPGDGACWASEKATSLRTRHNVRAHAVTRAMNRAISNLVGGGDVSAEELTDYTDEDEPATAHPAQQRAVQQPQRPQAAPRPAPAANTAAKKPVSEWNGLADAAFRKRLTALGYRTVAQVEEFLTWARDKAEQNGVPLRDAAYRGLAQVEKKAAEKAAAGGSADVDEGVDADAADVVDGEVVEDAL